MEKELKFLEENLNESAIAEIKVWRERYKKNNLVLELKNNSAFTELVNIIKNNVNSINRRLMTDEEMDEKTRYSLFQYKKAFSLLTSFFDIEAVEKDNEDIQKEVDRNVLNIKQLNN